MKFKVFAIIFSFLFLLSCSNDNSNLKEELSVIIISSDHSVGKNILNFAILDINGNQITDKLESVIVRNLNSDYELVLETKFQKWFEGKGAYKSKLNLDESGFYELLIKINNIESKAIFNVNKKSLTPTIGEKPPILKTLKASKVSDLKKITSDPNPDMNLYNISYEDAIKNSKPTIVLFSTPALCVSGTCGPILENLKNIKKDYDEFNFLHIEVYKNFINKTLRDLDTLEVTDPVIEWGLPTEPWIFFLDNNGILKSKFEGFISENELISELNLLKDF